MGRQFGQVAHLRGLVMYRLSNMEQKAFAGAFSQGAANLWRRFASKFFIVAPPLICTYLIYDMGESENARLSRKNPDDYKDEK